MTFARLGGALCLLAIVMILIGTFGNRWVSISVGNNSGGLGLLELEACRDTFPDHYIRVAAFDSTHGRESVVLSFIVNRPREEPGFRLVRTEGPGRSMRYAIESYAVQTRPEGRRYE